MTSIKFFYNGMKVNNGKLEKCHYSEGNYEKYNKGTITIYAREYTPFSHEIRAMFQVDNNSDIMTDYMEKDRIRVQPNHILYPQVKEALEEMKRHNEKRWAKKWG